MRGLARPFRCRVTPATVAAILIASVALSLAPTGSLLAMDEDVRELRLPSVLVESEPQPEIGFELPPSAYPIQPVDQSPFHGARHGLVNTTTGGLVFRTEDMRVQGRMPIQMTRIYDSKFSTSMPPPPPAKYLEPRWTEDFGRNWALSFSSYLVAYAGGYTMTTPEGDRIQWGLQPGGSYKPVNEVPSRHVIMQPGSPTTLVETQLDGSRWTYTSGVGTGAAYFLTSIVDRSGNHIGITYANGYMREIANSSGFKVTITRLRDDPNHPPVSYSTARITKIRDNPGRDVHFAYDTAGRLISVTDMADKVWTYAYDAQDKLISASDPLGNTYLTAGYDAQFRATSYAADAGAWTVAYSVTTTVTDALSNVWEYEFDPVTGLTTEIHEPTGGVHAFTYDADNNPLSYVDPQGVTASWTYDANQLPITHTPPGSGGASVTYAYDPDKLWIDAVTSLDGGVTTFTRDAQGRVIEELHPDGGKTTATYAANGDRLTLRRPMGNAPGATDDYEWSFVYDNFGKVTEATDPTGRVFETDYTINGELWKLRRPDHVDQGQVVYSEWIYDRDVFGRITSSTDPLGSIWSRTYDDAGRLIRVAGPAGTVMRYVYDAMSRPTQIIVEIDGVNDAVTTLGYDSAGRLVSKSVPTGETWTYAYDGAGRLIETTDPLSRSWSYGRDLAGRVTSKTFPGGQQVTMLRDSAGRLIERNFPGGRTETFAYGTTHGRLTQAEAVEGAELDEVSATIDYIYDNMGRPTEITTSQVKNPYGTYRALEFTYDLNGNRATLYSTSPGDETVTYTYDELDRLTGSYSNNRDDWTVTYDLYAGHRTRIDSGDRWETWVHDAAGRMVDHAWNWPGLDAGSLSQSFDAEGRVTWSHVAPAGITRSISYGPLGLPTQIDTDDGSEVLASSYTYDLNGNLLESVKTLGAEPPERVLVLRDPAGRITSARRGTTMRTYTWEDASGSDPAALRVWRAPNEATERAVEVEYGYDGRIRAIRAHDGADPTPIEVANYFWSPLAVPLALISEELDETGALNQKRMALELGGFYAQQGQSGNVTGLTSPVAGIDAASRTLSSTLGSAIPNPTAPFLLGAWRSEPLAHAGVMRPSSALASSVEITDILRTWEQRSPVTLASTQRVQSIDNSLQEDWLDTPTVQGDLDGDQALGITPGNLLVEPAGTPLADYDASCPFWWCGQQHTNYFVVDPCENHIRDFGPPLGGCGLPLMVGGWPGPPGSQPDLCKFTFARPSGYPEPLRNPDFSEGGVSLVNGDFFLNVTDISAYDTAGSIEFTRNYHSGFYASGELGNQWTHNWGERLLLGTGEFYGCGKTYRWVHPGGGSVDFHIDTSGEVTNPPDSTDRLRKIDDQTYEIRNVSGTVKTFSGTDGVYTLTRIERGGQALDLVYDNNGRLDRIESNGTSRMSFDYYDGEDRIREVSVAGDSVEYEYNGCGELERVKRPLTRLDPASPNTYQPTTKYSYVNLTPQDCEHLGGGFHLLTEVRAGQFDPLTGASSSDLLLQNFYKTESNYGVHDPDYLKVIGQCFGESACTDADDAELRYEYTVPNLSENHTTTIWDYRLGATPVIDQHHFQYNNLVQLVEDLGGLGRTTVYEYEYFTKLRYKVINPDGSCDLTGYDPVGGVRLPTLSVHQSKESCAGEPTTVPDQVTLATYEELTGQIRTFTGPEAFPDGVVPDPFDPHAEAYKPFTTLYDYDLHQSSTALPAELQAICTEWELTCPEMLGDLNDNPSDDAQWFGSVVRVRQWDPGNEDLSAAFRTTTAVSQPSGRRIRETGPDGVSTEYEYYDTSNWDWRPPGSAGTSSASGSGPLALVRTSPASGTAPPLERRQAWSSRVQLLAEAGPDGVRSEYLYAADGLLLRSTICAPDSPVAVCDPGVGSHNVLLYTDTTHDLRGRTVREVARSGDASDPNFPRTTWTTYNDRGNPETVTVDPDPAVVPGQTGGSPPYLHLLQRMLYDGRNRLVGTVSPEGRTACVEYDALDRQIRATAHENLYVAGSGDCPAAHPDDAVTETLYDVMDRPFVSTRHITDSRTLKTYSWYDRLGRQVFVADGKPTGALDPILGYGQTVSAPTASRYLQTSFDHVGRPIRGRFFGATGHGTNGFLSLGWTQYDTLGRVVSKTAAISPSTVPSATANLTEPPATEPQGVRLATVEYRYDEAGRRKKIVDKTGDPAQSRITEMVYDEFGRLQSTLHPAAGARRPDETTYVYDAFGRIERTTATLFDPDEVCNPNCVGHSRKTESSYDAWGRVWKVTASPDNQRRVSTFDYDAGGKLIRQVQRWLDDGSTDHASDRISEFLYDRADRLTTSKQAESFDGTNHVWAVTTREYDDDGMVVGLIDPNQRRTDWTYDGIGRLQTHRQPAVGPHRQTTRFAYDKAGNALVIQKQEKAVETSPRVVTTSQYDDYSRLLDQTATLENGGGTSYVFTGTTQKTFEYDALGRIVRAVDVDPSRPAAEQEIEIGRFFDTAGRLTQEQFSFPLNGSVSTHSIESVYARDGFREALRYPRTFNELQQETDRFVLTFVPDELGRVQSIHGPLSPIEPTDPVTQRGSRELSSYRYLGSSVWSRAAGNGTELRVFDGSPSPATSLYDDLGQPRGLRAVVSDGTVGAGATIADFRYGYDRVGNRTYEQRRHEPLGGTPALFRSRAFSADLLNRLQTWVEGGLEAGEPIPDNAPDPAAVPSAPSDSEAWLLDQAGNWLQKTKGVGDSTPDVFAVNALNQYTSVNPDGSGAKVYAQDWLGQLRRDEASNRSFIWDLFGRLTEVRDFAGSTLIAGYRYDAFNRRVERTVEPGNLVTRFLYDGWNAIEERAVVGTSPLQSEVVRARYGFGIGADEVLWMDRDISLTPFPPADWRRYFVHPDGTGSAVALSADRDPGSENLAIVERYTYEAYGNPSVWVGPWNQPLGAYPGPPTTDSTVGFPYLFTGQRRDVESGLYYYKNRYFEPKQGRFLSRDPIGLQGGPNLYEYVGGQPQSRADSLGLFSETQWMQGQLNRATDVGMARRSMNQPNERRVEPNWQDTRVDVKELANEGLRGCLGERPYGPPDPQVSPFGPRQTTVPLGPPFANASGPTRSYRPEETDQSVTVYADGKPATWNERKRRGFWSRVGDFFRGLGGSGQGSLRVDEDNPDLTRKYPDADIEPTEAAAVIVAALLADDVTGVGVGDNALIPVVVAAAAAAEVTARTFITYVLTNPTTGQRYVGRTSGFGTPHSIMMNRFYAHHMRALGFGSPVLDQAVQSWGGAVPIRGREQQMIDALGGVGSPGVGNVIRGVRKDNPAGPAFHLAANLMFGEIHPYTGN